MTDYQGNAKRLAEQIGFNYRWDAKTEQFAHAAAIMILTPDGRCPVICTGCSTRRGTCVWRWRKHPKASWARVSDKVLLYCFHYDASAKSYVPFAGTSCGPEAR